MSDGMIAVAQERQNQGLGELEPRQQEDGRKNMESKLSSQGNHRPDITQIIHTPSTPILRSSHMTKGGR